MAKSNSGWIALIIVFILIGASVGAYYYFFYLGEDKGKKDPPPPPPQNQIPVAFFEMLNGSEGRVNDLMYFDANESYDPDPDGRIISFDWDWGDGNTVSLNSTNLIANHTYGIPGEFTINLTVWDDRGSKGSYTDTISIRPTDYTDSNAAILMSREASGVSLKSINRTIPVDEFAISMEINITILGASFDSAIEEAILEVEIFDPIFNVKANESKSTRIQSENFNFFFDTSDLLITGNYEMVATCTQGSLYLSYNIEVLY